MELQSKKEAIQELANQLFQHEHTKKQLMLLRIINRLVAARLVEVRYVCEAMLNALVYAGPTRPSSSSSSSKPTNTFVWCKVLEAVRKFIPQHDYKSCRDIFKMLLEVIKRIPHSVASVPPPLETELVFLSTHKKTAGKRRLLLDDYNSFQDVMAASSTSPTESIATDDIKLESLYEVRIFDFGLFS